MKKIFLVLECMACLAVLNAGAAERPPNVIFIVIDTLRRDHMGCYNYGYPTTPEVDKIAGGGVRFDQAIAASSWTLPSVMSIFTSLTPSIHKLVDPAFKLPADITTLAAELKKGGYATVGITSNPLTSSRFGFSRGFDFYDDMTVIHRSDDLFLGPSELNQLRPKSAPPTSDRINQVALSWMEKRNRDKPQFLFLFYIDPHDDYTPPPPYNSRFTDPAYDGNCFGVGVRNLPSASLSSGDKRQLVGLYDGEIGFTDECVGRIMKNLETSGLCDNAITVVVADHGEEFWDHGGMFHGYTLYDELIRVPLIIRFPGRIHAGLVVKEQVSNLDIMPTILDMAGLPIPSQCVGRSLRSVLEGKSGMPTNRPAYMETFCESKNLKGVRTQTQKIVEQLHDNKTLLFDLVSDPLEQKNLFGTERANEFSNLMAQYNEWKKAVALQTNAPAEKAELFPRLLRQLQTMGYAH